MAASKINLNSTGMTRKFRRVTIFLAAAFVVGATGFGLQRLRAESPQGACVEQYNSLVEQAKADLISGDRAGAINSLTAARAQIRRCEVPSAISVSGIWH